MGTTKRKAAAQRRRRSVTQRLKPRDRRIAAAIGKHGIIRPYLTVAAAREADVTIATACALLEKETGGGHNIYGHDPTIFAGAGHVTEANYRRYKAERGHTRMQGVGPCQLTWWELQDEADRRGGCWNPYTNMVVGFEHLATLADREGSLRGGARAYNGTGAAAEKYAADLMAKREAWEKIVLRAIRGAA